MELILIRHGTTQGNLERRFIGRTDLPLLPAGEDLSRRVGASLPPVDHVYHSPMLRCVQTARLLWPGSGMTAVEDLRETDFGPFEGKNHEELKDDPLYQRWITAPDPGAVPVGESAQAVARRVSCGLRALLEDARSRGYGRVGVVSHGGALMALMACFGRPERPSLYDWSCPNCGGWRAAVEEPLALRVLDTVGGERP